MKTIEEYTPSELAVLATIIGITTASRFNVEQQNVVANFLFGVAQSIFIISAQLQNLKSQEEIKAGDTGNKGSNDSNSDLQNQINELKEYVKNLNTK